MSTKHTTQAKAKTKPKATTATRLRLQTMDPNKDKRNRLDKAIHRMADNIRRTDDPCAAYVLSQQLSVLTSSRVLAPVAVATVTTPRRVHNKKSRTA